MTARKLFAGLALVDFAALNAYALYKVGVGGIVDLLTGLGPWGWVLVADLLIALAMVVVWMWSDARERGRNPIGFTLLTLATGSLGPLLYVVTGEEEDESHVAHGAHPAAS